MKRLNKKGFTLVEVSISVGLLAVVMLFVVNFIVLIREDEDALGVETKLELNKALISSYINKDIKENDGISMLWKDTDNQIVIDLNNSERRKLLLERSGGNVILKYRDYKNDNLLFSRKSIDGYEMYFEEVQGPIYRCDIKVVGNPSYDVQIVSN